MIVPLKGKVYKTGTTKTGKFYFCCLVPGRDGNQDSVTVFSAKDYSSQMGKEVSVNMNCYIQMGNEVV